MLFEYQAPWWLPDGHSQTIWSAKAAVANTRVLAWEPQLWSTPDNDQVHVVVQRGLDTQPVLVMFHGLEGSSQSHYSRAFAQACAERGWTIVIPHFRGCGGVMNEAPRAYHSGDAAEIDWMMERVVQTYSPRPLYGVGISLGGNALMCWAGTYAAKAQRLMQGVVAISSPLDLVAAGRAIDQGVNRWLYARMFLQTMKRKAQQKWDQYPGLFDLQRALKASTLEAFDDAFTAPLHGFDGVMDYWQRASAKPLLGQIQTRALLVNALNDPFVPHESLPKANQVSEQVGLFQPPQGGHVGFCTQADPTAGWRGSVLSLPRAVCAWLAGETQQRTQQG